MKKIITLIMAALTCVCCAFGFAGCGSKTYVEEGKFIVVTNTPFGMYEYLGDDGKIYGIDIEIAGMFAEENNLEFVVKNINFNAIFTQVDVGYADAGMAGITVTDARKQMYDFTDTYCEASQKLIVLNDNNDFAAATSAAEMENILASLNDKKIGYQSGTTGEMYIIGDKDFEFDGFSNIQGAGYATAVMAVNDMINGNLYAVIVDEGPAKAIADAVEGVKVIDVKLTDEEYAFLLRKGNSELQKKFNDFIKKIKEDGTYAAIEAKYYQNVGTKIGYTLTVE